MDNPVTDVSKKFPKVSITMLTSTKLLMARLLPAELEAQINAIVGVVTNGLFAARPADLLLLGTAEGVKTLKAE